ncbi:hypothetical protein NM688_g768 [Phlebia brevispora]|uniref:Uncharacterized protein n=1 Tax=Phlebia brevispora TaxID=194682 RepID=A0ACC1TE63_9APHY|nr:hypothetical protein NM688_g768 [Phlebia brevispora]
MISISLIFLSAVLAHGAQAASSSRNLVQLLGPQSVNLWKLDRLASESSAWLTDDVTIQDAGQMHMNTRQFHARWFEQPLDHFSNSSETFLQRYWVNDRHYKSGSGKPTPVIVIDGGETSGANRLPFLDTGIAEILAKATGGIGVVLEHRYYGMLSIIKSKLTFLISSRCNRRVPSSTQLEFLNNAQSAADSANFMANIKFPGIAEDLTSPNTPWIYYGGSYAGARAAHMRVLYPDLVFGAIASSAVTHASIENWEYMEIIRNAADPKCISHLETSIQTIDHILSLPQTQLKRRLKGLFGVADLEHDEDFVSLIESPLGSWQAKNWDPAVGSNRWDEFCEALDKPIFGGAELEELIGDEEASYDQRSQLVTFYGMDGLQLDLSILNYAKYIKQNYVSQCPIDAGATVEQCFGTYDDEQFQGVSLDETWRLWVFQVCTEWGYFSTAPPEDHPRIVSKLLTLDYEAKICRQAFPPGKYFTVPHLPNVTVVNELGDFDIEADRLAIIDGDVDPWRPCTPHSDYARDRPDTVQKPFKLIPGGVHHYDENGLRNPAKEPFQIQKIHTEIVEFVTAWLEDWKAPKATIVEG